MHLIGVVRSALHLFTLSAVMTLGPLAYGFEQIDELSNLDPERSDRGASYLSFSSTPGNFSAYRGASMTYAHQNDRRFLSLVRSEEPSIDPGVFDFEVTHTEYPVQHDWEGLRRDTYYFFGYQLTAIAVLYMLPESVTNWDEEVKDDYSLERWKDNVSHPRWDPDDFFLNYILHPYWGASYFVRARNRGFGNAGSFGYSLFISTLYEFGMEALFEPPSVQDFFVTPIAGSLLGAYFMRVRERIYDRETHGEPLGKWDRFTLGITDPLGWANGKVDGWFGRDVTVAIQPFTRTSQLLSMQHMSALAPYRLDATPHQALQEHQQYPFNDEAVMGLQLKFEF